jgi:hypothetical protein
LQIVQYGPKGVMPRNEGSFSVMDAWLCGYCGYRLLLLPGTVVDETRSEAHSDTCSQETKSERIQGREVKELK